MEGTISILHPSANSCNKQTITYEHDKLKVNTNPTPDFHFLIRDFIESCELILSHVSNLS